VAAEALKGIAKAKIEAIAVVTATVTAALKVNFTSVPSMNAIDEMSEQ
jgi:hypothetical protein